MRNDIADLNHLLRLLAGRLPDGQLDHRRHDLAATELWELEINLLGYCAAHAIPLREEEIALLPEARACPGGSRIRKLTRWRETDRMPEYRFEPLDAEDSMAERLLLDMVRRDHLAVIRLRKAWRTPANAAAKNPPTVVYIAECAPGSDVSRRYGAFDVGSHGDQIEVVAEGEDLPPYQAGALAAGQLIWTSPTVITHPDSTAAATPESPDDHRHRTGGGATQLALDDLWDSRQQIESE
ncbi:hypothetical protein ABZV91_11930 [Nocardia sp. NPDC004568]|uniref:hypothetical protein n=1 Tax=Nocardia sp. NPDC004568 TaxID=3154551 RepID=UPI0033A2DA76